MTSSVLVIEDTPSLRMVYAAVLRGAGFFVHTASTAQEGYALFEAHRPPAVLLDLMLPDRDGLDLMADLLAGAPETSVVVITANGSINRAVQAMRAGAYEFLVKPFDENRMLGAIRNAMTDAMRQRADRPVPGAPSGVEPTAPEGFIGASPQMQDLYGKIQSVANSMATIFITGESGTGKELCAQAVHRMSSRASGPFVPLNCGAIPSELLESEVFGHLKGSFTGAISDKLGAAAAADGGTLFLDEICEMDLNLQTKLLRFLQTSTIQPVGAVKAHKVNVRIVCATNRDPLEEVRRGTFRQDLFYRLHVVPIHLPPLRERGDDILQIARTALSEAAREEGKAFEALSPEAEEIFRTLPWPGNVRQLLNTIRNIVVLNNATVVTPQMLPPDLAGGPAGASGLWPNGAGANGHDRLHTLPRPAARPGGSGAQPDAPAEGGGDAHSPDTALSALSGMTLSEIERLVIEDAIQRHGGSVPKAARTLGVSPSTLYRKREAWVTGDAAS